MNAAPTRTGGCLCGQITYSLTGDAIATAVCHCDHCQRQSGGAFSVNLVVHESQLALTGEPTVYEDRGDDGDDVYVERAFCPNCGSPIYSALVKTDGVIAVKVGTLDDTSDVRPQAEVWCERKQPWVSLPGMAISLDREG